MEFNSSPNPTIGVEIELQLIDNSTFDLKNLIHSLPNYFSLIYLHKTMILNKKFLNFALFFIFLFNTLLQKFYLT